MSLLNKSPQNETVNKENMKKILLACVLLATIFIACKKDETPAQKSIRELLIEKKWYQTAILIDPPYRGMSNMYDSLIPCQKDDIFTYKSNGIQEKDEGPTKCFSQWPQIDTSVSWKLNNSKLIQSFDIGASQQHHDTMDIELLTEKNLHLGITFKLGNTNYRYLYKYETR